MNYETTKNSVIPTAFVIPATRRHALAKAGAGIQTQMGRYLQPFLIWIPAFAGMTEKEREWHVTIAPFLL